MSKSFKKKASIFILLIAIYALINLNLKLPSGIIRLRYLISTPIKTDMSDVKNYLEKNNHEIWYVSNFGYRKTPFEKRQGSYHIGVIIGEYRWLFTRSVISIWIFDEDKKLIEIIVEKEIDII